MTTKYSPPAIPSLETGTPPREWSESVLASSPATDTPATFAEVKASTADPKMTEEKSQAESQVPKQLEEQPDKLSSESKQTTEADQSSMGATVVQTATQYVPEQVGKAVDYAAQTAASYIPDLQGIKDTVSSYLTTEERQEKSHVSLPSSELKGARPAESSGGVGALPGNLSESSVALLPDEREERDQEGRTTAPRQRRDTIKPSAVGGDNEPKVSEKEEAAIPISDAALPKEQPVVSQPSDRPSESTEAGTQTGENNLVASVGPEAESQKEVGETRGQQVQGEQGKVDATLSADELGEQRPEKDKLASQEPEQQKGPSQDVQEEGGKEGKHAHAKVLPGYGGDYHPAQLHPPPPGASAAEAQMSLGGQQAPGPDSPTTKTDKRALSEGAEKKPGFITMVKGEMKILAGKVRGDEQKVEQGKKIIHGEA